MALDEGIDEDEYTRESLTRVLDLVNLAMRESPGEFYQVSEEDFCDLYFNGGGYLTMNNRPCGKYFRHELICMDQNFVLLTDKTRDLMISKPF